MKDLGQILNDLQGNISKVENIELVNSSLLEAYRLINQTLLDDADYEHLNKQTREMLNGVLADIAMIIVRSASMPSYIIKKDK